MNILFSFNEPIIASRGGVQRVTEVLAKEFINRGHFVIFLSYEKNELIENNIFAAKQFFIDIKGQDELQNKQQIESLIYDNNIDCVIHQFVDSVIIKYVPKNIGKICVCHVQPFSFDGINRKRIWKTNAQNLRQLLFKIACLINPKICELFHNKGVVEEYKKVFSLADKVVFISDRFYHRLYKHIPKLDKTKLYAINNPNTFSSRKVDNNDQRDNILLYVGRVENAQKNVTDFIRSWALLADSNPLWKAIIIGDGADLDFNKKYVKRHKINNIEFLGRIENIEPYYKKSKIIAVTSYWESWCMVLTEAMAFGCVPCAYNTYETLQDIITDNGIITNQNTYSMANAIQQLINDNQLWSKMSNKACIDVEKFSVENTVDQWEKLLKKVINK